MSMPSNLSLLPLLAALLGVACKNVASTPTRTADASTATAPAAAAATAPVEGLFDFALMGDQQYTPLEEAAFARMMEELDGERVEFLVHLGDIKAAILPCTDGLLEARRAQFDRSAHPFVFLPGDNEWTDCHSMGGDPLERLRFLRTHFARGDESLGRKRMALARQREQGYPENVRWEHGRVLFLGLNVPGSNNDARIPEESRARDVANAAWLKEGFREAKARGLRGVLVAFHGNPGFPPGDRCPGLTGEYTHYAGWLSGLAREAAGFGGPVALVHGDTHCFQVDQPLKDPATGQVLRNVMRVEVPGSPQTGWVRGTVDPSSTALFRFTVAAPR
ncbi:MAG: hypothetical protein L0Y66_23315 [Myxococcaceae bacterium]|nr:hypothetical protein [Myxococcaceae bacterium]